jgi:hypothetical protein
MINYLFLTYIRQTDQRHWYLAVQAAGNCEEYRGRVLPNEPRLGSLVAVGVGRRFAEPVKGITNSLGRLSY